MLTALWAILIFCLLIFVHEFGHFIVAKLCKMTVHEFSIGMGPKLFGFGKKSTKYNVRLLPLGGYVALEGEDSKSEDVNAFSNKSIFKRFCVLFAGAFMNIILGFLLFVIVYSNVTGVYSNKVSYIEEKSAFYDAGINKGDIITKIEGDNFSTKVHTLRDVRFFLSINGNDSAKITYIRNGEKKITSVTPRYNNDSQSYVLGFSTEKMPTNFVNVIKLSFWECIFVIKSVFLSLWWLITGVVSPSAMSGPVAIVGEIQNAAKMGWQSVLNLGAFISVNLGVMNLLPIPALDGGRILFLLIEKIRGKKLTGDKEATINFVFFVILISLMILVTFSDISKLF